MPALSQGVLLAWRLAAEEATRTGQRCIERESLFIGLCYLDTWLRSRPSGGDSLPEDEQGLQALHAEAAAMAEPLWAMGLSPTRLCHAVHTALARGHYKYIKGAKIHRSAACKAAFQRAEALMAPSASEVHCLHLLGGIVEAPGTILTRVIEAYGVQVHTLHSKIIAAIGKLGSHSGPAKRQGLGVSHIIYMGANLPS